MLDALVRGDGTRAVDLLVAHLRSSVDLVAESLGGGPFGAGLARASWTAC